MSNSGEKFREIERKWRVPRWRSFNRVEKQIVDYYLKKELVPPSQILFAETIDTYWDAPAKAQFVRLRHSWGSRLSGEKSVLKEITVKQKDKGGNLNRFESNIAIESIQDAKAALGAALGPPIGVIRKYEAVVFAHEGVVVSLCKINDTDVMIEVEGPTVESLKYHAKALDLGNLEQEFKNLFELYIQKEES